MRSNHITNRGYVRTYLPDHPNAGIRGWVLEHVAVAASVCTGGRLPTTARVHHVNGIKTDNRKSNIVVCENQSYHLTLHRRQRALEECGDPRKVQCWYCRGWDHPENMRGRRNKSQFHHLACAAKWQKDARDRRRATRPRSRYAPIEPGRTHCVNGHPWVEVNLRRDKKGHLACRLCNIRAQRACRRVRP